MVKTIESIGPLLEKFPLLQDGDFVGRYPHILLVTAVVHSVGIVNEYMGHSNIMLLERGFSNIDHYLDTLDDARIKSVKKWNNYHKRAIDLYREIKDRIYFLHNTEWDGETNIE